MADTTSQLQDTTGAATGAATKGVSALLTAACPWVGITSQLVGLGFQYYAAKKAKKEAEAQERAAKAETARIQSIIDKLNTFGSSLPSRSIELSLWHTFLSQSVDYFMSARFPCTDEFLTAIHRRIVMGTLATGRDSNAALFYSLPYLWDSSINSTNIGIIIVMNSGKRLYYQTPDIGVPAQAFSYADTPWAKNDDAIEIMDGQETNYYRATTKDTYLAADPQEIDIAGIKNIYIVKGDSTTATIDTTTKSFFSKSVNIPFISKDGSVARFALECNLKNISGTQSIMRTVIDSFYGDLENDTVRADKNYRPYSEYTVNEPPIRFVPFLEIQNKTTVVLNWYDSLNNNFFGIEKRKSILEDTTNINSRKVALILLAEKGFVKAIDSFDNVTQDEYTAIVIGFQLANHLQPIGYIDKITEAVLRGQYGTRRTWGAYNWAIEAPPASIEVQGLSINNPTGNLVKLRQVGLPITANELSEVIDTWTNKSYGNYSTFQVPPNTHTSIAGGSWSAFTADDDDWLNSFISIKSDKRKDYRILGGRLCSRGWKSRGKNKPKRGLESLTATNEAMSMRVWLGRNDSWRHHYYFYVQKVSQLVSGIVVSRPFFPVIKSLSDFNIPYISVKGFGLENSTLKLEFCPNSSFKTRETWTTGIIAVNQQLTHPIIIDPKHLFVRWAITLNPTADNTSPVLNEVTIEFKPVSTYEVNTNTLKTRLDIAKNNYNSVDTIITNLNITQDQRDIYALVKMKRLIFLDDWTTLQAQVTISEIRLNELLKYRTVRALNPTELAELRTISEELERIVEVLKPDKEAATKRLREAIKTKIASVRTTAEVVRKERTQALFDTYAMPVYLATGQSTTKADNMVKDIVNTNAAIQTQWQNILSKQASITYTIEKTIDSIDTQALSRMKVGVDAITDSFDDGEQVLLRILDSIDRQSTTLLSTIDIYFRGQETPTKNLWTAIGDALAKANITITPIEYEAKIDFTTDVSTINLGSSHTLSWNVLNCSNVKINNVTMFSTGTMTITPKTAGTMGYTLTATTNNTAKTPVNQTITVVVQSAGVVPPIIVVPPRTDTIDKNNDLLWGGGIVLAALLLRGTR